MQPFLEALEEAVKYSEDSCLQQKIDELFGPVHQSTPNAQDILSYCITQKLMDWITTAMKSKQFIFEQIYPILDVSIELASQKYLPRNFVIVAMTDLLEMMPSVHAEKFFTYIELRQKRLLKVRTQI